METGYAVFGRASGIGIDPNAVNFASAVVILTIEFPSQLGREQSGAVVNRAWR